MQSATPRQPGKTEARLSLALMAILVIIAGGVVMRQYRLDPTAIALRQESGQHGLTTAALIDTGGTGLVPFSAPERFGPIPLHEKIDGRADLYLSSGFVSLDTQRSTTDPAAGSWVELYVYDIAAAPDRIALTMDDRRHLDGYARETFSHYRAGCRANCESAVAGHIPVGNVMCCLMYARSYGAVDEARRGFAAIPQAVRRRMARADYARAEIRCPRRLPIARMMKEAVDELA